MLRSSLSLAAVLSLLALVSVNSLGCGSSGSEDDVDNAGAGAALSANDEGVTQRTQLSTADGKQIVIQYTPQTVKDASESDEATNVSFTTTNMQNGSVRIVVLDECTETNKPSFEIVAQCDLHDFGGGRWGGSLSECQILKQPDNFDAAFPNWLVTRTTGSDAIKCSQQVAVAADGNFFSDPVNGSHNFNFQMK